MVRYLRLALIGLGLILAVGLSLARLQPLFAQEETPPGISKQEEVPGKGLHKGWEQGEHKGWNKEAAGKAHDISQEKREILKDTRAIKGDRREIRQDNAAIKEDRRELKDAILSGDKDRIRAEKGELRQDLKERRHDIHQLNQDRRERKEDARGLSQQKRRMEHMGHHGAARIKK